MKTHENKHFRNGIHFWANFRRNRPNVIVVQTSRSTKCCVDEIVFDQMSRKQKRYPVVVKETRNRPDTRRMSLLNSVYTVPVSQTSKIGECQETVNVSQCSRSKGV